MPFTKVASGQSKHSTWFSYLTMNIWPKTSTDISKRSRYTNMAAKKWDNINETSNSQHVQVLSLTMRKLEAMIHVNTVMGNSNFKQKWFVFRMRLNLGHFHSVRHTKFLQLVWLPSGKYSNHWWLAWLPFRHSDLCNAHYLARCF